MKKDNCKIKSISESYEENISRISLTTCKPVKFHTYNFDKNGFLLSEESGTLGVGLKQVSLRTYHIEGKTNNSINGGRNESPVSTCTVDEKWMIDYVKTILSANKKSYRENVTYEYEYDEYNNWVKKTVLVNNVKKSRYDREIKYYSENDL